MQIKEEVLLDIQNRWFGEHRAKCGTGKGEKS